MTRDDIKAVLTEELPKYGGDISVLDSLDLVELQMACEERCDETLGNLEPPPYPFTEDGVIDAILKSKPC